MIERPSRPSWPGLFRPPEPPQPSKHVRHVRVLPPLGRPGARAGLVLAWRRVQRGASPAAWQAMVAVFDERIERLEVEWYFATELVPVRSLPSASVSAWLG